MKFCKAESAAKGRPLRKPALALLCQFAEIQFESLVASKGIEEFLSCVKAEHWTVEEVWKYERGVGRKILWITLEAD